MIAIEELKAAYHRGENVTERARSLGYSERDAIEIAYQLQAGSYIDQDRKPGIYYSRDSGAIVEHQASEIVEYRKRWAAEIDRVLQRFYRGGLSILEAGVGEATTLRYLAEMNRGDSLAFHGCDLSEDRIKRGADYLSEAGISANMFVADIYDLPLSDRSIDVVYTSHSIEPNGERGEAAAITELLRVAREAVVLVEPDWHLSTDEGKSRIERNNYAARCIDACGSLGLEVRLYRPMPVFRNLLNPSSVIVIRKGAI